MIIGSLRRDQRVIRNLINFIRLYVIILFIPLAIASIVYAYQVKKIEADILDVSMNDLQLNKMLLESTIVAIDSAIANIRQDTSFNTILKITNPLDRSRVMEILKSYQSSILSSVSELYLLDILVYFKGADILFTQDYIFLDPERFYRYFYQEEGIDYQVWKKNLQLPQYHQKILTTRSVKYNGVRRGAVVVSSSLPFTTRVKSSGTVIALIDRTAIEDLIRTRLVRNRGFAYILLPDETLFAYASIDGFEKFPVLDRLPGEKGIVYKEVNGTKMAISYLVSEHNSWMYVVGIPKKVFAKQSRSIVISLGVLIAVALVIGIPTSVVFANRSNRPFLQIAGILKKSAMLREEPDGNPDRSIVDTIADMVRRNLVLRTQLRQQSPFVKEMVMDRLFRGDFGSKNELRAFLNYFEITLDDSFFAACCILIDEYFDVVGAEVLREFSIKIALIKEHLVGCLCEKALIHEIGLNVIGVIVPLSSSDRASSQHELKNLINQIRNRIRSQGEIRCIVAPGLVAEGIDKVAVALRQAVEEAYRLTKGVGGEFLEITDASMAYYYPPEVELRVINLISTGRSLELEQLIDSIRKENLVSRKLSKSALKGLAKEIEGTYAKIGGKISLDLSTLKTGCVPIKDSMEEVQRLLALLLETSREISDVTRTRSRITVPVLHFIDENYSEHDMSLCKVAKEFRLSEAYLSRLIKGAAGESFSSYLERRRMESAATLLKLGRFNVDEVAFKVGYKSSRTFRRAFKRHQGMTPSALI